MEETTYIQHLKTKQVLYYMLLLKTIALLMAIRGLEQQYFLEKNNALYKSGKERINNEALMILVATSRPEDKDIMMQLIKTMIK